MKSSEICTLAIQIVTWQYGEVEYRDGTSYYNPNNASYYNGLTWWDSDQRWHSDCLGLLRAVLCGWNANKQADCGGSDQHYYCYSGADPNPGGYTVGSEAWFQYTCTSAHGGGGVFTDFSQLTTPCCLLYKASGHVGLFVGEFQFGGQTYNTCECTLGGFPFSGGYPTYTDTDGTRRRYKGDTYNAGQWTSWGIFNTNGTDYGITEYDGGAIPGTTGFGTELTQAETEQYFDQVYDQDWLTYAYLEALADSLFGMDSAYFRCFAGYVYGENPVWFDDYMLYLDSSITVNQFMAWGATTPALLAQAYGAVDQSGYYSEQNMTNRGYSMEADNTIAGKRSRAGILLAMLNPNQYCMECVGYPVYDPSPPSWRIIYTQHHLMPQDIDQWALKSAYEDKTYDVTGSGIRGGIPSPYGKKRRFPLWMMLKPYYMYNQYRYGNLLL